MSDDELVEVIRQHPDRAVTAIEIAEKVDMTSKGVLKRLDELKEKEIVTKKKVGSRAVVWWIADDYDSESRPRPSGVNQ